MKYKRIDEGIPKKKASPKKVEEGYEDLVVYLLVFIFVVGEGFIPDEEDCDRPSIRNMDVYPPTRWNKDQLWEAVYPLYLESGKILSKLGVPTQTKSMAAVEEIVKDMGIDPYMDMENERLWGLLDTARILTKAVIEKNQLIGLPPIEDMFPLVEDASEDEEFSLPSFDDYPLPEEMESLFKELNSSTDLIQIRDLTPKLETAIRRWTGIWLYGVEEDE